MDRTSGPAHHAAALWTAFVVPALGAAFVACGVVLAGGLRVPASPDPEALLGLVAAGVGSAVVLVWALGAVLALVAVLAGHHRWERVAALCARCSPSLLRRAAATVLGLQLVGLSSASADDTPSPFWHRDDRTPVHASPAPLGETPSAPSAPSSPARSAGPAPSIPAGVPAPAPRAAGAVPVPPPAVQLPAPAQRTVDGAVTVVRGDTLWSLAAAHLGPGATDAQIASCWPAWYELNRHVLVDGPHLIFPGQRLLVPSRGTAAPSTQATAPHQIPGGPS